MKTLILLLMVSLINCSAQITRPHDISGDAKTKRTGRDSLDAARRKAANFFESINTAQYKKRVYQLNFTPFFPTVWANKEATGWVSYVYAVGTEFSVADAVRNTKAFGVITYNPITRQAAFRKTSAQLKIGDKQGVKARSKSIYNILDGEKEIENILLDTQSESELSAANTQPIIIFYTTWKLVFGVIYQEISVNHRAFESWLLDKSSAVQNGRQIKFVKDWRSFER